MKRIHQFIATFLLFVFSLSWLPSLSFCGFYVAQAGAELFNDKSEVIIVRKENRTTITMSNDFQGDVKDFAMVVPVPVVLQESDIKVVQPWVFDKMDTYSGPRLVEYYDTQPCPVEYTYRNEIAKSVMITDVMADVADIENLAEEGLGVFIEAEYEVGEYDILILSATESKGLKTWLDRNDYDIPAQAEEVLDPYIKDQMKFFVVKVNLERNYANSAEYLSPIQISFDSPKFMLPIRLGMANSRGAQDMIVYALTDEGRVECTNYRTMKIPTDRNIPTFVKPKFGEFYKDLFDREYAQEGRNAVFLEYAWNISPTTAVKCDPCNGPPPVNQDLVEAGVDWILQNRNSQVFFTRLHVRYSRDKFPQDLQFQVTPNREHFQGRYIMTHPPRGGDFSCDEGQRYLRDLEIRRKKEVDELYVLTGWNKDSGSYIYEYSNQIDHEKNSSPIFVLPGGGVDKTRPLLLIISLTTVMVLTSVWLGLKLQQSRR